MKKKLLAIFLLVSSLIFSEDRVLSFEQITLDEKNELIYAIGEKSPYTGIVEDYKFFIENRFLEGRAIFKNGLMEGTFKVLYPNGKIARIMIYKNGKTEGIQKVYYESGIIKRETSHKNGLVDGLMKSYYPSGKLKIELPLDKNGLTNGIVKIYYPSGKIMSEKSYKDDKLEGTVKIYDESGKIISEEFFKNGNRIK